MTYQRFYQHRLFWPAMVLVLLLVLNIFFSHNFFRITVHDGTWSAR